MGSSFVRYKEHGFWTKDQFLLDWLMAALIEIDRLESPPEWQIEMGKTWDNAIMSGFPGGIDPELDAVLTGEDRVQFLISLSKKIIEKSIDPKVKRLGELFIALTDGSLKTTVSSPIDYW